MRQNNPKITRGISEEFAQVFKQCELHELYEKNKDDLIIGVRNDYLNIYYNCDSIAKVTYNSRNKKIVCEIDKYYIDGISRKGKDKNFKISPENLVSHYEVIKENSNKKSTDEKKAQAKLYILNNSNVDSNWFCIDVEYVKAFKNLKEKQEANFNARFDIIAISRTKNNHHKIALIELKYGSGSMGGNSGVYKHIHDFSKFIEKGYFESQLQEEIIQILESQKHLGIPIPFEIPSKNDLSSPEFFFITLDNNPKSTDGSTPKQTMSGYLFEDGRWDCKKISTKTVEKEFGDITKKSNELNATLLFSKQNFSTQDDLAIFDIIDDKDYERISPK